MIFFVFPLTKGYFGIVDIQDSDLAKSRNWCAQENERNVYVIHTKWNDGKPKRRHLHRMIYEKMSGVALESQQKIDHRDRNGLNNSRTNIRLASNSQNTINSRLTSKNKSGVKGVCWKADKQRWRAYISIDGRQKDLGLFKKFEDAVKARRDAEVEHYGEFA